jgi:hypothetical protein
MLTLTQDRYIMIVRRPWTRWRRRAGALVLLAGVGLAAASPVQASDAGFRRALKPFETRLTAGIGYLSSFSAPRRGAAPAALARLARIQTDLAAATSAASRNPASTSAGRTGRSDVLSALRHARAAATDAQRSATAARAGRRATAARDARAEQREINASIPLFEKGGQLLHLF